MDLGDTVDVVVAAGAVLGEGPSWDARSGRLLWIDVVAKQIFLTDVRTGASEVVPVPLPIGAVVPRAAGGFLAALEDGFWVVGDGPQHRVTTVPEARPGLRFNDGKCDPEGRFWAGTMADDQSPAAGALYRLGPDGQATLVLDGVTLSNGLAWSADGLTMYFIDSPTQRIDAFSFTPSTGEIRDRRPLVQIPREVGIPDGMTIDTQGGLWVALWDGGAVHRYLDGRLDRVINLPVSQPTSCAFGGDNFEELFVTSACDGLSSEQRAAQPLAGAVFRIRPGVRGLPPASYFEA